MIYITPRAVKEATVFIKKFILMQYQEERRGKQGE